MRVDSASLIAGALVVGDRGLGVLGSDIPATGEHGAGFLYNDLSLPADAGKEVRGLIVTPPAAGEFFAYEDTSFTFVGAPDGAYTFVYRLFVDGADLGTATATLNVGSVTTVNLTGNNATQNNNSSTGAITSGSNIIEERRPVVFINRNVENDQDKVKKVIRQYFDEYEFLQGAIPDKEQIFNAIVMQLQGNESRPKLKKLVNSEIEKHFERIAEDEDEESLLMLM